MVIVGEVDVPAGVMNQLVELTVPEVIHRASLLGTPLTDLFCALARLLAP